LNAPERIPLRLVEFGVRDRVTSDRSAVHSRQRTSRDAAGKPGI
jgi:hypothetical protein